VSTAAVRSWSSSSMTRSAPSTGPALIWVHRPVGERAAGAFTVRATARPFDDLGNPVVGPVNVPLRRVDFVIQEGVLKIRDSSRAV